MQRFILTLSCGDRKGSSLRSPISCSRRTATSSTARSSDDPSTRPVLHARSLRAPASALGSRPCAPASRRSPKDRDGLDLTRPAGEAAGALMVSGTATASTICCFATDRRLARSRSRRSCPTTGISTIGRVQQHSVPLHAMTAANKPRAGSRLLELLARRAHRSGGAGALHADPMLRLCEQLGPGNQHPPFVPAELSRAPSPTSQARRGVKLIGATAHYVTEDLDEGPIIEQDVARVDHRRRVAGLRGGGPRCGECGVGACREMACGTSRSAERKWFGGLFLGAHQGSLVCT